MMKYKGLKFLLSGGFIPGLTIKAIAQMDLLLNTGACSPLYVDSEKTFRLVSGKGAMESKWNRESGISQVSIIDS